MNDEIVKILMQRDDISREEAENLVRQTQDEIDEAVFYGAGIEEVEEIIADNLKLEPEYISYLLF